MTQLSLRLLTPEGVSTVPMAVLILALTAGRTRPYGTTSRQVRVSFTVPSNVPSIAPGVTASHISPRLS